MYLQQIKIKFDYNINPYQTDVLCMCMVYIKPDIYDGEGKAKLMR